MKHIVILGAGISGLSVAWYLKQKSSSPLSITLLEKSDRVGGWIHTLHEEEGIFETGPRGFRPKGKGEKTLQLAYKLGLSEDLILANKNAKKRYLLQNAKLQPLPTNPCGYFLSSRFRFLIPLLLRERKIPPANKEEESIADFFRRRFSQKMHEVFIDSLVSGVFGGDPEKLSLPSCFPMLAKWEKERGSIFKGLFSKGKKSGVKAHLCSFKKGMETLPITLAQKLQAEGIHLYFDSPVSKLTFHGKKADILCGSKVYKADYVISALPLEALKKCDTPLKSLFEKMETASIAAVSVAYRQKPTKFSGYGYLIPSSEKENVLGVTFDSDIFPEQDKKSVFRYTVMLGGTRGKHLLKKNKEKLLKIAGEALKRHLGITQEPCYTHLSVAQNALPQYTLGHKKRVGNIEKMRPHRLLLTGNAFYGVGINDCIDHAEKLVDDFLKK